LGALDRKILSLFIGFSLQRVNKNWYPGWR
jgi:hypothetical protein